MFGTKIQVVSTNDEKWLISSKEETTGTVKTFLTSKLMVASGVTSVPHMPVFPGKENFGGPIIYQEAFGSSNLLSSPGMKNTAVLGGAKSSADMSYAAVKAGKIVTWIFKSTNTTGPGFFLAPKGKGPYKNAFEIAMTRLSATSTPSFMNRDTLWTRFLHGTKLGLKMMNSFWGAVDQEARKDANFEVGRVCKVSKS